MGALLQDRWIQKSRPGLDSSSPLPPPGKEEL
jgi:hypothetical protein